jgi:pimeloyl-ACP methyl ester carboxylesterase
LPPPGTGTLLFDRRGEGESTGRAAVSYDQLAADVRAWLRLLSADPRVSLVGLWGISQGRCSTPRPAGRTPT